MTNYRDDFTSADAREGGVSGILVPDDDGYLRAIFTDATREHLRKTFTQIFKTTVNDHEPINARREGNLKAYEARTEKGEAITLPVVKRDVNQQLAWHLDAIFSKKPPFTATALDNDPQEILVDQGDGRGAQVVMIAGDEYAKQLQELVNYYLLHRVGFKKTARAWILALLQDGNRPPVLKVIYEERERQSGGLNVVRNNDGQIERIEKDPVFRTVKDGEPTRIEAIPGDKFFVPLPYDDIQRAPFVFQEFEEDPVTTKDKIARGIYDFCRANGPDQNEIDLVLSGCKSPSDLDKWRADGRIPTDPLRTGKFYELWFDYPFAEPVTNEDGAIGSEITVRMVPFCAVVHADTGFFMNCYENNRWDRKRPFFAGRQQDRPFSFSGYCTAENVAPFQTLMTQLFNAQLQNLAVNSVATFGFREGSPTARFFKAGAKLRPGLIYPFADPDDILVKPLGSPVASMSQEIAYLGNESEKMSVVTEYDRGAVPNRTPVGTVNAVDAQAKMQPRMALDNIRDTIGEVIECFVRTLAQFNPDGVRVPFRDPTTADGIEIKTVGFPIEWREGMFSFSITATGDEETAQSLTMRDIMFGDQQSKIVGEWMSIMNATMQPDTPPPLAIMGMTMIRGRRNMFARVLSHNGLNADDYMPTQRQIEQLPLELQQLQMIAQKQQMMQQQPEMMQGGMGGGQIPTPDGGGAVPPPSSGPQPIPFMARQSNDEGVGEPSEAGAL